MTKKFIPLFIILAVLGFNPASTSAERLISNPSLITLDTAPHSSKPVKKKVATKRNLRLGMTGNDVLVLQKFLIKKATGPAAIALANNKATGRFGPLTKSALEEFQQAKGLIVDGVAGAKVRAQYNK